MIKRVSNLNCFKVLQGVIIIRVIASIESSYYRSTDHARHHTLFQKKILRAFCCSRIIWNHLAHLVIRSSVKCTKRMHHVHACAHTLLSINTINVLTLAVVQESLNDGETKPILPPRQCRQSDVPFNPTHGQAIDAVSQRTLSKPMDAVF